MLGVARGLHGDFPSATLLRSRKSVNERVKVEEDEEDNSDEKRRRDSSHLHIYEVV